MAQLAISGLLQTSGGVAIPVEAAISAQIKINGSRLAVTSFRNLSAREQAMRDAAYREAMERTMPCGLAEVSDTGEQLYVNDRFCEMVGWQKDELIGKDPPFVYWPPDENAHIHTVMQNAISGAVIPAGHEVNLMHKSGRRFPVQILVSRVDYGSHHGTLGFIIDVSDRKRIEAALEEARRLEGIGQLAGQVAHDFNNLLTVITMHVAIARMSIGNNTDLEEPLVAMAEAAKRGNRITKSLLAVARKQLLTPELVEVGAQMVELKPLIVATCGPKIAFSFSLPSEPLWISVDPGGLTGALLNLVSNSRDAMPGGGTAGIRILTKTVASSTLGPSELLSTGRYVVIEVWDTGNGMTSAVRGRAFEPFFSTKGRVGTGLGLAAVYGFARQSGGLAEIESELGKGTKVRLLIPTVAASEQIPAPAIAEPKTETQKILIVDDELEIRKAIARLLEAAGHTVTTAADGERALVILETEEIDLLITDIIMPGIGGVALAERVAQSHPHVSIALMTGFGMREPEDELPWDVIEKPFGPDIIPNLLARLVAKRGAKTA